MAGMEEKTRAVMPHQVILEDRKTLSVTGVSDVDSFDGLTVVAYTDLGELTVKGSGLQIQRLNVESGDLLLTGEIDSLTYSEQSARRGGGLRRLFR